MAKVNTIVIKVDTVSFETSFSDVVEAAHMIENGINEHIEYLEAQDGIDVSSVQVINRTDTQQIAIITYRQLVKADR